jgi:deoxyribodipyrimidine photo-lyase
MVRQPFGRASDHLHLNNRYFLDGRDANSYANVAWLFGVHERAHQERRILGKGRYMSEGGLRRKMNTEPYVQRVAEQCKTETPARNRLNANALRIVLSA